MKTSKKGCGTGGPGAMGASFGLPQVPGISNFAANQAGLSSIAPSTPSIGRIAKTPSFKAPKMANLPNLQSALGARTTNTSSNEQRLKVDSSSPTSTKSKRNILTRLVRRSSAAPKKKKL